MAARKPEVEALEDIRFRTCLWKAIFEALLGAKDNRDLLIHFLNATHGADLPSPVTQVDILNPYNGREFLTDKLSIVDVKARDDHARLYQAEIQLRK